MIMPRTSWYLGRFERDVDHDEEREQRDRASQVVMGEERKRRMVFNTPNSWTPRCLPQVGCVIATKGFQTFYDAEASALATV